LVSESKGNGLGCADKAKELNGALQVMEKGLLAHGVLGWAVAGAKQVAEKGSNWSEFLE
jgi:hypothetical protein